MNTIDRNEAIAEIKIQEAFVELATETPETVAAVVAQPETVVAAVVAPVATEGKRVTNSQKMRDHIAMLKANGGTVQDAIEFGMNTLKQSKALATRYAVENWERDTTPKRGTCKLTVGKSVAGVAPKKVTNADRVRELIATAKREGRDHAAVIEQAMAELGQTKSLATAYVNNNWSKVVV